MTSSCRCSYNTTLAMLNAANVSTRGVIKYFGVSEDAAHRCAPCELLSRLQSRPRARSIMLLATGVCPTSWLPSRPAAS
jgi:hypothetical protein